MQDDFAYMLEHFTTIFKAFVLSGTPSETFTDRPVHLPSGVIETVFLTSETPPLDFRYHLPKLLELQYIAHIVADEQQNQ